MSSPGTPPRALVAGHGDFATGLVSAVVQITGTGDRFLGGDFTGNVATRSAITAEPSVEIENRFAA